MKHFKMSVLAALVVFSMTSPVHASCTDKLADMIKSRENVALCVSGIFGLLPFGYPISFATDGGPHSALDWLCTSYLRPTYDLFKEAEEFKGDEDNSSPNLNQFVERLIRYEQKHTPDEPTPFLADSITRYSAEVAKVLKIANQQEFFCPGQQTDTVEEIYWDFIHGKVHKDLELEKVGFGDLNV